MTTFRYLRRVAMSLIPWLALTASAQTPCSGTWIPGSGISGVEGNVYATLPFPDGSVVLGGWFASAGSADAKNVCRVDPDGNVVSMGWTSYAQVHTLFLTREGDILAGTGGSLEVSALLRFNTATNTWIPFAGGVFGDNSRVQSIAYLPDGDLVVGGTFSIAGDTPVTNIARYHPVTETWSSMAGGVTRSPGETNAYFADVNAMVAHPNGNLYVMGTFTSASDQPAGGFATYHPSTDSWSVDTAGFSAGGSFVRADTALGLSNGSILVGGYFTQVAGLPALYVARFQPSSNTWSALGGGTNGPVEAMLELTNGSVVAVGSFTSSGIYSANGIAIYSLASNAWSPVQPGLSSQLFSGSGVSLCQWPDGRLLIGGFFDRIGDAFVYNIGLLDLDSQSGSPLIPGSDGSIRAMLDLPNGDSIVTGTFTHLDGQPLSHAAILHSDGSWSPLGSGLSPGVSYGGYCLARLPNGLVMMGGLFPSAGGAARTHNLAIVDPSTGVWQGVSATPNGGVNALRVLPDGRVAIAGSFSAVGPQAARGLAIYDPVSDSWEAPPPVPVGRFAYDTAMLHDGRLAVAFGQSDQRSIPSGSLAAYDLFTHSWEDFGAAADGYIRSLLTLPSGELVAGGTFANIASQPTDGVALFNPEDGSWSPMGGGLAGGGSNTGVYTLALDHSGSIIAGGRFSRTDGSPFSLPFLGNIARFSPQLRIWLPLGTGVSLPTEEPRITCAVLARPGSSLLVGGGFGRAGSMPSALIARWQQDCSPCDADVNQDGRLDSGDVVYLVGIIAGGYNPSHLSPDFNHDGNADQSDIDALITVIAGGDCP